MLLAKHLETDEVLIRAVHKHWLLGIRSLFWPTCFLLVGGALLVFYPVRGVIWAVGMWSLACFVWWLRSFFDYYLDAWLITDQGIIDIAWHGWFHRESTRVLFSDLQGVSYEIRGILGTMLRFGSISVEKISTGMNIRLESVRHPKKIEMLILQSMEAYLHKKNLKDARQVQELLATLVAERVQLQQVPDASS
jgi:hypothetical protein